MAIFPHGKKMRLDFTIKGQRITRSFNSRAECVAFEELTRKRVAIGLPAIEEQEPARDMTVGDALKAASKQWAHNKDGAGSTGLGTQVATFLGLQRKMASITADDQQALIAHFREAGNTNGTINRKLSAFSGLLKVARDAGVVVSVRIQKLQEDSGRVRVLSSFEEKQVFTHLRGHGNTEAEDFADFVAVALDTGGRLSELLAIDPLWLRQGLAGDWVLTFPKAKSKARTVPLTGRAASILVARFVASSQGWPARWNVDKVDALWASMRAAIGMAGDKEFVFHACRHTCATRLLEATGNLVLVRDWLGHADIKTTTIYAKVVPGQLTVGAKALDAFHANT